MDTAASEEQQPGTISVHLLCSISGFLAQRQQCEQAEREEADRHHAADTEKVGEEALVVNSEGLANGFTSEKGMRKKTEQVSRPRG